MLPTPGLVEALGLGVRCHPRAGGAVRQAEQRWTPAHRKAPNQGRPATTAARLVGCGHRSPPLGAFPTRLVDCGRWGWAAVVVSTAAGGPRGAHDRGPPEGVLRTPPRPRWAAVVGPLP